MLKKFLLITSAIGLFSVFSWIISFYSVSNYPLIYFPHQNISLCACDRCVADFEPGFSELYEKAPEPFLSPESNISNNVFKYWSRLNRGGSYNWYKETEKKVFEMFPPGPKLAEPSPDLCRTCAVVGNSGNLKGSFYGPLIDYHDIVIRMNKAPTKGYERDVGNKTTHHVMYPLSATNLTNTTHLVFFPSKKKDLLWLIEAFTLSKEQGSGLQANKELVMILNPAFTYYVHELWLNGRGVYPSTGFLSLILSLHMCDEVDVFGFGADKYGSWQHYYERLRRHFGTGHHVGRKESMIIQQLQQQGKIRFFQGSG